MWTHSFSVCFCRTLALSPTQKCIFHRKSKQMSPRALASEACRAGWAACRANWQWGGWDMVQPPESWPVWSKIMCLALHICTSGTVGDLCCSPPHISHLQVWAYTHLKILENFSVSLAFEVVDLSPQVWTVVYIDQFSPLLIVRWDFLLLNWEKSKPTKAKVLLVIMLILTGPFRNSNYTVIIVQQ